MICQLHPSNGEIDECPSCQAGSPPDLGVVANDAAQAEDKGPGQS